MEYIIISSKKKNNEHIHDQWMNRYLLMQEFSTVYEKELFSNWCNLFINIDEYLKNEYKGRLDYKNNDHFHILYNQLTKEIVIIITNSYHIYVKCDKIPIGVVKTIRNYYPNILLFCRNKEFEEVEI